MSADIEKKPVDLGRRRLTQGGLAGSVLLASFISKNALAAPYQCTMSGLLSNNLSPKGPLTSQSCDLGPGADDLVGEGANWWGVGKDLPFSDVFDDVYHKVTTGEGDLATTVLVAASLGGTKATLGDVISLGGGSPPPPNLELGRAAIAAYVGWSKEGANYPLTDLQIRRMFNDTVLGGEHHFSTSLGTVKLNAAEVLAYFNYLTGGPNPKDSITR